MKRKLVLWLSLCFLFMQVSSCTSIFSFFMKKLIENIKEKEIPTPKDIVHSVTRQKIPHIARPITAIIFEYLFPRPASRIYFNNNYIINQVLISHNNRYLFMNGIGRDNLSSMKVWDTKNNKYVRKYKSEQDSTNTMLSLFNNDNTLVVQNDRAGIVFERCWNPSTSDDRMKKKIDKLPLWLKTGSDNTRYRLFKEHKYVFAMDYNEKKIIAWNRDSSELSKDFLFNHDINDIQVLQLTSDQKWLITLTSIKSGRGIDGIHTVIYVWNFNTGQLMANLSMDSTISSESSSVIINEKWMAVGWKYGGILNIFSLPHLATLRVLRCSAWKITSCAHVYHKDGTNMFAIGTSSGTIEIWICLLDHDLFDTARRIQTFDTGLLTEVSSCCFTFGGDKLIFTITDLIEDHSEIRILDPKSGKKYAGYTELFKSK